MSTLPGASPHSLSCSALCLFPDAPGRRLSLGLTAPVGPMASSFPSECLCHLPMLTSALGGEMEVGGDQGVKTYDSQAK